MSFWAGLKQFGGMLFGSPTAMGTVVEGAVAGIDKLVYTEEEKAEGAAAERSEGRQMVVAWMAATQGQNLARRLIALSITGVWLMQYLVAQMAFSVAIFLDEPDDLKELAAFMRDSASDMDGAVMLILAFYFAAPHMGDFAKAMVDRFKRSVNKG